MLQVGKKIIIPFLLGRAWKTDVKTNMMIRQTQPPRAVFENFTKFTGKHLCQSLLFHKVASLRPAALLEKWLWRRCFPVNSSKFSRTPIFIKQFRWLLLYVVGAANAGNHWNKGENWLDMADKVNQSKFENNDQKWPKSFKFA